MRIQEVTDISFRKYGRVIRGFDYSELLKEMKNTPMPEDVIYVPSVGNMEALEVAEAMQNSIYGGLPIQIGYCNGHNDRLNAVEYHRCSEVDIAVELYATILHYAPCGVGENIKCQKNQEEKEDE